MTFKVGDEVEAVSCGYSSKNGKVIAILGKHEMTPGGVVVEHEAFGYNTGMYTQLFKEDGTQADGSEHVTIRHKVRYQYANVWNGQGTTVGDWLDNPKIGYRGPRFAGQLRAKVDSTGYRSSIEFNPNGY